MANCNGVSYTVTLPEGKYHSEWFDCGDEWDEADEIEGLLKKLKAKKSKAKKACSGGDDDCDVNQFCRPVSVTVKADSGKATLKRVKTKVDGDDLCQYLVVLKEESKITVTTTCRCLTIPD